MFVFVFGFGSVDDRFLILSRRLTRKVICQVSGYILMRFRWKTSHFGMNCILITSKCLLSLSQWTQMSPFQPFSPSEGCVITPAQRDLAARSLPASISPPCWTYSLSVAYIPEKIVLEIKGSTYTENIQNSTFSKLHPWQQTCSDSRFHTTSVCVPGQLVFILAAVDLPHLFFEKKKEIKL